ncbi:hypothetical protein GGR50DRAFT_269374 [Xylaria sp. CBS 124048]|nr:hypothetical protein GGR50DRAFT_269374 [Xylaria sp. CBS 124048]
MVQYLPGLLQVLRASLSGLLAGQGFLQCPPPLLASPGSSVPATLCFHHFASIVDFSAVFLSFSFLSPPHSFQPFVAITDTVTLFGSIPFLRLPILLPRRA